MDHETCSVGAVYPIRFIDIDVLPESFSEQPETYQSRAAEGATYNIVLYILWALSLVASFTVA